MHSIKSIRDALKGVYRGIRADFGGVRRCVKGLNNKLLLSYMEENSIRGLHLGCGLNIIPGFLNADAFPVSDNIFQLDVTKAFPFDSNSFDLMFSEHMIEHISYLDGLHMLRECRRILKKGGVIRISTPSLRRIVGLSKEVASEFERDYLRWSVSQFLPHVSSNYAAHVINNFFRDWGHQFIYTEQVLQDSLERCGFTGVRSCSLNQSGVGELRNLENESRMPAGFLAFETFTLEAVNPG